MTGAPTAELPGWVWMISSTDYRDHAVTKTSLEVGLTAGFGHFLAMCGHTVIVCSLYEPPGPVCPNCRRQLTAPRSRPRRTWWRRWTR